MTSSSPCFRPACDIVLTAAVVLCHVILRVTSETPTSSNAGLFSICPTRCTCTSVSGSLQSSIVNCSSGIELSTPTFRLSNRTEVVRMTGYPMDLLSLATILLRDCPALNLLAVNGARLQSLNGLAAPETLKTLDLSHNLMSMIADRVFIRVTMIRRLDLSYNRIEAINHDAFFGLGELLELDVSANRLGMNIDVMSLRWICCLPSIERLNLSRNGFHVIHDSFFDCRPTHHHAPLTTSSSTTTQSPFVTSSPPVRDLDLSINRIRYIAEHAFDGLSSIEELRLNDNALLMLPLAAIRRLTVLDVSLSGLDLSGNEFDVIERGSFCNITRLERLRLGRLNRLRLIEKHAFVNMTSLRMLDVSQSHRLRYVNREAFDSVPSLSTFNLSSNRLETLEREVIRALPGLLQLDVTSNPLVCDCLTGWLLRSGTGNNSLNTSSNLSAFDNLDVLVEDSFCDPLGSDLIKPRRTSASTSPSLSTTSGRARKLTNLERRNNVEANRASVAMQLASAPPQNSAEDSPLSVNGTSKLGDSQRPVDSSWISGQQKAFNSEVLDVAGGFSSLCRPRILEMFDVDVLVAVTDTVRLDCIAVGYPMLSTSWILPAAYRQSEAHAWSNDVTDDDQRIYDDDDDETTEMTQVRISNGTLLIGAVTKHHQGNYTCLATVAGGNGSHVDERTIRVRVKSSSTGIIVLRVTSSTLTVTWRGLQSSREYRVRFHEKRRDSSNNGSRVATSSGDVIVKPYMRSFTASDLRPDTDYVFCIDIRQTPNAVAVWGHMTAFPPSAVHHGVPPFVTVSCMVTSTRHRKFADHLVRSRGIHILVLCVTAFASASLVVALATLVTRRYDRRKRLQMVRDPSTIVTSSSMALDASQLQLTASCSAASCVVSASSLTYENREAIERQDKQQLERDENNCYTTTIAENDDYDYVAMFDSDDLEEMRMTTSMQL